MMDHVSTRCAQYRLLFPSRNIESILTLSEQTRLLPLLAKERKQSAKPPARAVPEDDAPQPGPVLDLRILLGAQSADGARARIRLEWVSSDATRRATLIVDAVDEIVTSRLVQLEKVAFLPATLKPLCEGVLRDEDSTFRLGIRLDVQWPQNPFWRGRLWRRAMVRLEGDASPVRPQAQKPLST